MALINTELLLQPVSAASPAGESLEYLPEFAALERAAEGKPAREMGASIVAGEPPNYPRVIELGVELLARSKDLRIAVKVVRALIDTAGFAGLAEGLGLVRGLVETHWQHLHPELDPDDGDATMRMAALAVLGTPELVAAVRAAPLLRSPRFGPISLRDVAIAAGDLAQKPSHPELDMDVITGIFREAAPEVLQELLARFQSARTDLGAIRAVLESSPGGTPDFNPLDRALYQAGIFVRPYLEQRANGAATEAQGDAAEGSSTPVQRPTSVRRSNGGGGLGAIQSRDDVVQLLDRICEYYAENEPSSPLPLLLRRCRRLVPLSFMEIVRDMAPDALSQVENIAGKSES
jgi:type VI secretion system protein ImpA